MTVQRMPSRMRLVLLLVLICLMPVAAAAQEDGDGPAAIALTYGVEISGSLGNAAPSTIYAFDGLRGEVVNINVTTTQGNLDPVLTVLDSSGALLAQADDDASGQNVHLDSLRLPRTDRYQVIVGRFGYGLGTTSGAYDLFVDRIGVSSSSGSALRYGDTVINQISDTNPQLYYSFHARRGDIVNVKMQRISGNLDTYLQVVNRNALVIADNDDVPGSGSLDAQVDALVIEDDGTYVIIASRFGQAAGTSTGAFSLTLQEAADSGLGNSVAAALPLTEDLPMEGELTNERYVRYYRFEARTNEAITVRMERVGGALDTFVAIMNVAGTELVSNDDQQDSQNSLIENFIIPADGAYYVVATRYQRADGQSTGRFRLTFERRGNTIPNTQADTRFIPYGSTITGSISDETPAITYAFYGQQGDVITVAMTRGDGDLDPLVQILDSGQQPLLTNDDSGGTQDARIDRFSLPITGVYYIRATRYTGADNPRTRGSFILVLAQRFD